jgi:hypothetical protein
LAPLLHSERCMSRSLQQRTTTQPDVLAQTSSKEKATKVQNQNIPSPQAQEDAFAELKRLREENARLRKTQTQGRVSLKVSAKGALSAYGLGRFPVTLYPSQWQKLMAAKDHIESFIQEHASEFAVKPAAEAEDKKA